jgi:hypothetical protein
MPCKASVMQGDLIKIFACKSSSIYYIPMRQKIEGSKNCDLNGAMNARVFGEFWMVRHQREIQHES